MNDQITRIKDKLTKLRGNGWERFKEQIGLKEHKLQTNPVATEEELIAFENRHGIKLPEGYRLFLKEIGDGGAGPYYGILPLERWDYAFYFENDEPPTNFLSQPCKLKKESSRSKTWLEDLGIDPDADDSKRWSGTITIVSQGCTYFALLVVTGELRGRVVYIDCDGQAPLLVPDTSFLDWYERWLDETAADLEIHWFGTSRGGSDAELLEALKSGDTDVRADAVIGLARRKSPSKEITEALVNAATNDPESQVREYALSSLRNSGRAGINAAIQGLQEKNNEVVKSAAFLLGEVGEKGFLSAIKSWISKDDQGEKAITALRQALLRASDDDTFFGIGCALRRLNALLAEDLIPYLKHTDAKIRAHTAWFLGEAKDRIAIPHLLESMNDTDQMVRVYSIQSLSHNFQTQEILRAFEQRLEIETDALVITNLRNALGRY